MTKESNLGEVSALFDITEDDDLTAAIILLELTPVAIIMPAAWTAANLTFQHGDANGIFTNLYDDAGSEVVVTVAASRYIRLVPSEWVNMRQLKIRSGTSGTPVAQAADRTLIIVTRNY